MKQCNMLLFKIRKKKLCLSIRKSLNNRISTRNANATNILNSINLISDFWGVLFMLTRSKWRARLCVLLTFILGYMSNFVINQKLSIRKRQMYVRMLGHYGQYDLLLSKNCTFHVFWTDIWTKTKEKKRETARRLPSTKFAPVICMQVPTYEPAFFFPCGSDKIVFQHFGSWRRKSNEKHRKTIMVSRICRVRWYK